MLPVLGYSTNVHAYHDVSTLDVALTGPVAAVRDRLGWETLPVELWLPAQLAAELEVAPEAIESLRQNLDENHLAAVTINGFPLQDFHQPVVKDEAYAPDWLHPDRASATCAIARVFADLLPEGQGGSISTVPGSYKPWGHHRALLCEMARNLAPALAELDRLYRETGKCIVLALEPEPFCSLETTAEAVDFIQEIAHAQTVEALQDHHDYRESAALDVVQRHLGLTLDAAHLAVEFEDPVRALDEIEAARIPLAKVHLGCAARLLDPARDRRGLQAWHSLAERKYLHQTIGIDRHGNRIFVANDLPALFDLSADELSRLAEVRTHFHLPLDRDRCGAFVTTRDVTETLLRETRARNLCDCFITETYTWPVLPGDATTQSADTDPPRTPASADPIPAGIARELAWARGVGEF